MGNERVVRPPRDGEDPVDWMYSTGQMSAKVYAMVKTSPGGTVAASAATPAAVAASAQADEDPLLTESLRHREAVRDYRSGRGSVNPSSLR